MPVIVFTHSISSDQTVPVKVYIRVYSPDFDIQITLTFLFRLKPSQCTSAIIWMHSINIVGNLNTMTCGKSNKFFEIILDIMLSIC